MAGESGFDDVAEWAERLETLAADTAERAGPKVLKALQSTARAQQEPDGTPWPPGTERSQVLTGAAAAMSVTIRGITIRVRLAPPYVFHDYGAGGSSQTRDALRARASAERRRAKTGTRSKFHAPRRKMLPDVDDPVPKSVLEALETAATEAFEKT